MLLAVLLLYGIALYWAPLMLRPVWRAFWVVFSFRDLGNNNYPRLNSSLNNGGRALLAKVLGNPLFFKNNVNGASFAETFNINLTQRGKDFCFIFLETLVEQLVLMTDESSFVILNGFYNWRCQSWSLFKIYWNGLIWLVYFFKKK